MRAAISSLSAPQQPSCRFEPLSRLLSRRRDAGMRLTLVVAAACGFATARSPPGPYCWRLEPLPAVALVLALTAPSNGSRHSGQRGAAPASKAAI